MRTGSRSVRERGVEARPAEKHPGRVHARRHPAGVGSLRYLSEKVALDSVGLNFFYLENESHIHLMRGYIPQLTSFDQDQVY
jgi:hypothetical protein